MYYLQPACPLSLFLPIHPHPVPVLNSTPAHRVPESPPLLDSEF